MATIVVCSPMRCLMRRRAEPAAQLFDVINKCEMSPSSSTFEHSNVSDCVDLPVLREISFSDTQSSATVIARLRRRDAACEQTGRQCSPHPRCARYYSCNPPAFFEHLLTLHTIRVSQCSHGPEMIHEWYDAASDLPLILIKRGAGRFLCKYITNRFLHMV